MAEKLGEAVLELRTDDRALDRGIGRAETRSLQLARNFERVGRRMTMALTLPLLALGAVSIRAFADFEASMANVGTLVDRTTESIAEMSDEVIAIGRRTPVALADLSAGLYDIRSAGIGAGDAMAVLEGSGRLAVAGLGTTEEAVDLVTSSINAFGLAGEEQERVYDLLFRTVQSGKTTISELAQGFGAAAPVVANAGIEIDEYLASVAALTSVGLPAAQAHTQIRAAIAGLMRDTEQTRAVFTALQVENFQQLIEQSGGMVGAFQRIGQALGGNDAKMIELVGSIEAYNAIIGLTGRSNDIFQRALEGMRSGVIAIDQAFEDQAKTASANLQILRNELSAAAIQIGAELLPAMTGGVRIIRLLITAFGELPGPVRSALIRLLAVAAAIGPLMFIAGKFILVWGTLLRLFGGFAALRLFAAGLATVTAQLGLMAGAQVAAAGAAGVLRAALLLLFGTVGGVVTVIAALGLGLYYLYGQTNQAAQASREYREREEQLAETQAEVDRITQQLATSTGEAAVAARQAAIEAQRLAQQRVRQAQTAIAAARAELQLARAQLARRAVEAQATRVAANPMGGGMGTELSGPIGAGAQRRVSQAQLDLESAVRVNNREARMLRQLTEQINAPVPDAAVPAVAALASTGDAAEGAAERTEDAARRIGRSLDDISERLARGLTPGRLPEATEAANGFREELDRLAEDARDAGQASAGFLARIAALRAQIEPMEIAGLAREAAEFAEEVSALGDDVERFATGGLPPLDQRLSEVDDRFVSLRGEVQQAIADNAALAGSNADAARSMEQLTAMLGEVEAAHRSATEAAQAQHRADELLADLRARGEGVDVTRAIEDLRQARGDMGAISAANEDMLRIERQLQDERLRSAQRLIELGKQRDEAVRVNNQSEMARLEELLRLQGRYDDLVGETTAAQIAAQARLQDAFRTFTQGLSDSLLSIITNFDGSLSSLFDVFKRLLEDLVLRPAADGAASWISQGLQSLLGGGKGGGGIFGGGSSGKSVGGGGKSFAGMFAKGGLIPSGSFGIVGERGPEPVFGTSRGAQVFPNSVFSQGFGGGGRVQLDVTTDGDWINARIVSVSGGVVNEAAPGIAAQGAGMARKQAFRRSRSNLSGG